MEKTINKIEELQEILDDIKFINSSLDLKYKFNVSPFTMTNGINYGWLIWCEFERKDCNTGQTSIGWGRKEIIWNQATVSYIVKTAWVLIKLLVEHELMEGFTWRAYRIFNPHNSVEDLAKIDGNSIKVQQ
jgi:hypothetical protein